MTEARMEITEKELEVLAMAAEAEGQSISDFLYRLTGSYLSAVYGEEPQPLAA